MNDSPSANEPLLYHHNKYGDRFDLEIFPFSFVRQRSDTLICRLTLTAKLRKSTVAGQVHPTKTKTDDDKED